MRDVEGRGEDMAAKGLVLLAGATVAAVAACAVVAAVRLARRWRR
jgi:hypothetical protein